MIAECILLLAAAGWLVTAAMRRATSIGAGGPVCFDAPLQVLQRYPGLATAPYRTPDIAIDGVFVRTTLDGRWNPSAADVESFTDALTATDDARRRIGFEIVLCNRSRPPPLLAIPGGYVELGESIETTLVRELFEETGIVVGDFLPAVGTGTKAEGAVARSAEAIRAVDGARDQPAVNALIRILTDGNTRAGSRPDHELQARLFGVYADPLRDLRRHTASVVYLLLAPLLSPAAAVGPRGKDDVKHCQFWPLDSIVQADDAERAGAGKTIFAFDHSLLVRDIHRWLKASVMTFT
jgi:ADP-ribose pyrophosphatase YjhB (NUDIX family)